MEKKKRIPIISFIIGILVTTLFLSMVIITEPFRNNSVANLNQKETERVIISPTPDRIINDGNSSTALESKNFNCIKPFKSFVVEPDVTYSMGETNIIPPIAPWQMVADLPTQAENDYVVMTRQFNGNREIWVSGKDFYVYTPNSNLWRTVPKAVNEIEAKIVKLFQMRDGSIWGQNEGNNPVANQYPEKMPLLSQYDEQTQRFVPFLNALEITRPDAGSAAGTSQPIVVLDHQDVFWIFHSDGTIYKFDPAIALTTRMNTSFQARQAIVAPNGSIFLEKYEKPDNEHISKGDVMQFFPKTGEMVALVPPNEAWPIFMNFSMFVDHNDSLWIDSLGNRKADGSWHLLFPDIQRYAENLGDPLWFMPVIQFESSDGLLWLYKATDVVAVDGTAWFDPKTGEGCVFTNLPARIIEDPQHILWLAANGKLYQYKRK